MNVLLVEEEARSAPLVRRALRLAGVRAHLDSVFDGVEAVEFVFAMGVYSWRDPKARVDAMIVDLQSPRLSGLELVKILRFHPRTRPVPLIAIAGTPDEERIAAERFADLPVVRKPISWMDLARIFREMWREGDTRHETRAAMGSAR